MFPSFGRYLKTATYPHKIKERIPEMWYKTFIMEYLYILTFKQKYNCFHL